MAVLKNQIKLHKFTAPTAENITAGAGINNTIAAANSDTGGKNGGETQYLPSEATRAKICKMQRAECERLHSEAKEILNILNVIGKDIVEHKKNVDEIIKSLAGIGKEINEHKEGLSEKDYCELKRWLAVTRIEYDNVLSEAKKTNATFCSIEIIYKPFVEAVAILLEKRLAEIETESEAD